MSQAILLRTMARKSVFQAGQFEGLSVQQVIDKRNTRKLRWIYFNYSMISFLPDILDEIGINEEYRIKKPGKDPEKGEMLNAQKDNNIYHSLNPKIKWGSRNLMKKESKDKFYSYLRLSKVSKKQMQAKNHGK